MPRTAPLPSALLTKTGRSPVILAGLGTAVPPLTITQAQALAYIEARFGAGSGALALYRKVLGHPSIATRHLAVDNLDEVLEADPDKVEARYTRWATQLGRDALARALAATGTTADRVDFLVTTTCTGSLCPGLSSYVAESLGLPARVATADLAGMGCGAAVPALRAAADFVATRPGAVAAVVAAEISSAAMFVADDPGLIVSNAIFADGAAAAVLTSAADPNGPAASRPAPRLVDFGSVLKPAWRDTLRFRTDGGRRRNVLHRDVPARTTEAMAELVPDLLGRHGLTREDVGTWTLHAGGATVLDALRDGLGLTETHLASSRRVLKDYGNMSSPTVLFALADQLAVDPPAPGTFGVLAAFGAGFSAHAALLAF